MAYLKKAVEQFGLIRLNDLPSEWILPDHGQWYQLILRMFSLRSVDDLFDHSRSSERLTNTVRSDRILEVDVSLNELLSLESHDLQNFSQLRKLNASLNHISRYHGVDALKNLIFLDLSHNRIKFVARQLAECRFLRTLNLAVNEIDDLSSLPSFSCIYTLFIDHNQLKSLNGIHSFPAVRELHIHHNHLTDLSPLSACTQLAIMNASDNNISKLSMVVGTLSRLKLLQDLTLFNNPIAREPSYRSSLSSLSSLQVLDNVRVDPADARHLELPALSRVSRAESWNYAAKTPKLAAPTPALKPVNLNMIQLQYPQLDLPATGARAAERNGEHSMELARQAYHQHLHEKKRQKDETIRYLARQMQMVEEEFKEYEEKSLNEMNSCIKHLSAAKETQPQTIPVNYLQSLLTPSSSNKPNWAPVVFTTRGKPVEVILSDAHKPMHHADSSEFVVPLMQTNKRQPIATSLPLSERRIKTTDYRDVKDTNEVLRHAYRELSTIANRNN